MNIELPVLSCLFRQLCPRRLYAFIATVNIGMCIYHLGLIFDTVSIEQWAIQTYIANDDQLRHKQQR